MKKLILLAICTLFLFGCQVDRYNGVVSSITPEIFFGEPVDRVCIFSLEGEYCFYQKPNETTFDTVFPMIRIIDDNGIIFNMTEDNAAIYMKQWLDAR